MKKALFSVLALVLGLTLVALSVPFTLPAGSAVAQDDPYVCLRGASPGQNITLTGYGDTWAGLFHMTVDGVHYEGWCFDLDKYIRLNVCFDANVSNAPRETPYWCEIGYILTNFSPTSNFEAAAIQLAIWKYVYGGKNSVVATAPVNMDNTANDIYDAAWGKSVIGPGLSLTLEPEGPTTEAGGVASQDFIATITDSVCIEGIVGEVEFSINNGSFTPPPSAADHSETVPIVNGKASVTVYWDTTPGSFTVSLTAQTSEGMWPVKIQPDDPDIQPIIISEPWDLDATKQWQWEGELGSIKILKQDDQGAALVGSGFTITPDPKTGSGSLEVIDGGLNDADGVANGELLVTGCMISATQTYTVEETTVPNGYQKAATQTGIIINSTTTVVLTFVNTETCGLQIEKRDWYTDEIVNRPGLTVRITPNPYTGTGYLDVEDNVSPEDKHTTGYGIILLLDMDCDLCYDIEEIQAPDGYNLDSDPVTGVCVGSIVTVTFFNTPISDCETAFAYHGGYAGECFSEYGFSRWGWSIGPLSAGTYLFDIYAAAGQCDLSKGFLVGLLTVSYDGSTAMVTYSTLNSGFTMYETHLYVGSEPLPSKNDKYTVAPGQYPYIHDPIGLTVDQYEITGLSGDIYIVAHAIVCVDNNG